MRVILAGKIDVILAGLIDVTPSLFPSVEALLEPPVDISRELVQHPDTYDGI